MLILFPILSELTGSVIKCFSHHLHCTSKNRLSFRYALLRQSVIDKGTGEIMGKGRHRIGWLCARERPNDKSTYIFNNLRK